MARPKKDANATPTAERIVSSAIVLFSDLGYDGVSVRHIARESGITEGSIYNHFPGKEAILDAALERFRVELLEGGLATPTSMNVDIGKPLADILLADGATFFSRLRGDESRRVWRILMMEQYRNEKARAFLEEQVLELPRRFLAHLLSECRSAGTIRRDVDIDAAATVLAALYFEFSFHANLREAEGRESDDRYEALRSSIRVFASLIEDARA